MKAPGYISQAMRKGRHLKGRWGQAQSGQVAPEGTVEQWEHWDGTLDANVRLRSFQIGVPMGGRRSPAETMKLIQELEKVIRLNTVAKSRGDRRRQLETTLQAEDLKRRLVEVA